MAADENRRAADYTGRSWTVPTIFALDRRDSPLVRLASLGSAAVLLALIETPAVSRFFGCTPLGPVALTAVTASIALAIWGQHTLPFLEKTVSDLIRRS